MHTTWAWDKGPTAKVESSHGPICSSEVDLKVDFLTKVEYKLGTLDFDFQSQHLTKP